ncbi:hypothetical protein AB7C87_02220 [Natrarchaeobius sp. A-rgal3]|uniref:DUF7111 family protein n=1 Tax=Natrarchaeobius versutus TaxID=1679078 RepID=UPI00350EC52F
MIEDRTAEKNGIVANYDETETERLLEFRATGKTGTSGTDQQVGSTPGATAAIAQNRDGYAMLTVRPTVDGDELERYYGFDMALDHVAELLGVSPHELPVPDAASDMGM